MKSFHLKLIVYICKKAFAAIEALRRILQKIRNQARRVITGSSYDVRSADVLNNLKWKTLETRRFHTKATLMYTILNDLSAPQLRNSFVKLNDTNINYNLRNIETDLARPRPYTNFLKHSFKYSGAVLWNNLSYEAKTAQSLSNFKHRLTSSLSMPSTGSYWFHILNAYIYRTLLWCNISRTLLHCNVIVLYCNVM